ncbi:DUF1353 domain-containing protein [Helicobacter trogontum]|uniref:DUF1353 domain-containing protein n=1 Tax=Helicobacter trogontum TaxID=50960 RepID=A0A4U8SDN4_9HELI|nr:DUF1353 domain-containing protein [Helicobacter trogontum]TLD84260.1 DUF1353 domain-containing protein [Helicobacter trogontum]
MSKFRDPLHVKVLDDGKSYQVIESFTYYLEDDNECLLVVENGFITDFASVPRIFWSIFPPFGRYTKPAVLHDRLCVAFLNKELWNNVAINEAKLPVKLHNRFVRRSEADKMFLESMKSIKVNVFTRYILYFSVRLYAILQYGRKA